MRLWHLRIISKGFHGFSMCFFWPAMLLNTFGGHFVQTFKNLFISQFKLDQIGQLPEGSQSRWRLVARPFENHVRQNYPKSSSIFAVKNRDENLHWNQPVESGFRNPPVTPAPPALWCTGSRPRPSHAARPPARVAGSELLGWPRSRHEMRTCLEVLSKQTRWTFPSTSDHFHELDAWTPKPATVFVISKNGKLHFHQLAFFRSFESLTTSWGSSNMPRKVGVPIPARSPRVVIT